jgi:hypothetical protein
MEGQRQEIEMSGRMKFAHPEAGQTGRLIAYPPVTIRWVSVTVLTGCLYPVKQLILQIGISIKFTCFLISSMSVSNKDSEKNIL